MDLLRSAISLRQLHYLVAIADAGSFSAAADQTHVAQPALSRQIALLEAHVGLRLLHRSRKGVALTEGGVRLVGGLLLVERALARVLDAERRGDHRDLAQAIAVGGLPEHARDARVHRQARELAPQAGEVTVAVLTRTPSPLFSNMSP